MFDIFMDIFYVIVMYFYFFISQVFVKIDCVMFFGFVVFDGYGVCYNFMEVYINFFLLVYNSCVEINVVCLVYYLEKVFLDMCVLLQSYFWVKF